MMPDAEGQDGSGEERGLEEIAAELQARESKLAQIEREASELRFRLDKLGAGLLAGSDTAKTVIANRYRGRLRGELERKLKHLELAQNEVNRARARYEEARVMNAGLDG